MVNNFLSWFPNTSSSVWKTYLEEIKKLTCFEEQEKKLLENLSITPVLWFINKRNWVKLILEENTWIWYSNLQNKYIKLGLQEFPVKNKKLFGFWEDVTNNLIKKHIFSHENCHFLAFHMYKNWNWKYNDFITLFNKAYFIRKDFQLWLSKLGNLWIYIHNNTSHTEDVVELYNLYCYNPENLKNYLKYLTYTEENILKKEWLYKISINDANDIYNIISNTVKTYLQENGIISKI